MKVLIILFYLCFSSVTLAEVYKCNNNGKITFSDKPCGKGESITKYSLKALKAPKAKNNISKQNETVYSEMQICLGVQKWFIQPPIQCKRIGEIDSYNGFSLLEDSHLVTGKKVEDITNTSFHMAKEMNGNLIYQRKVDYTGSGKVPTEYSDRVIGTKSGLRAYLLNPIVYRCPTETLTSYSNGRKKIGCALVPRKL
jgi:hypothetical protein